MINKAMKYYNIDARKSFMVGDSMIDVVAGMRAGVKTVLVKTGPGHRRDEEFKHIKPNFIARDLLEAVRYIKTRK